VEGAVAVARGRGFPEIGLHERALNAPLLARFREAGLGVGVWGANHEASIERMLGLGVDIFATDDPPLAIRLRDGR
jgi:glycerophosphoryl diester phosphodiesterase